MEKRKNSNRNYVIFLTNDTLRDAIQAFQNETGLNQTQFINEFVKYLAEQDELTKNCRRSYTYVNFLKRTESTELKSVSDFDWTGHIKKFLNGTMPALDFGVACQMLQFMKLYNKK